MREDYNFEHQGEYLRFSRTSVKIVDGDEELDVYTEAVLDENKLRGGKTVYRDPETGKVQNVDYAGEDRNEIENLIDAAIDSKYGSDHESLLNSEVDNVKGPETAKTFAQR